MPHNMHILFHPACALASMCFRIRSYSKSLYRQKLTTTYTYIYISHTHSSHPKFSTSHLPIHNFSPHTYMGARKSTYYKFYINITPSNNKSQIKQSTTGRKYKKKTKLARLALNGGKWRVCVCALPKKMPHTQRRR